eukprot:Em0003g1089a
MSSLRLCIVLKVRLPNTPYFRPYLTLPHVYRSVQANLCNTTDDCYPADLIVHQVPAVYINCSDNKCVCTGCFYSTNGYKSCGYKRCWQYVAATHTCEDLRKDQRTAFLLSLFLSFVGAANFYIEQYTLGGLQLAFLVLMPIIIPAIWLIYVFIMLGTSAVCDWSNDVDTIAGYWPLIVSFVLWAMVILMWWVADIVTFAEDLRASGNGCPLRHNL